MSTIEQKRLWLSNFESLCPYLQKNINEQVIGLKKYLENPQKDRWEKYDIWNTEKSIFGHSYLTEIILSYWEKVLWQPIWYLNAIEQVPELLTDEDANNRFNLIYGEIQFSEDKNWRKEIQNYFPFQ